MTRKFSSDYKEKNAYRFVIWVLKIKQGHKTLPRPIPDDQKDSHLHMIYHKYFFFWYQKGERNRLTTIFSVIWSIHNKKSQSYFMFPCHRNTNINASYLPQSWLPEKAVSQAKKILVFSRYKDGTMQPKVRYGQQCYNM